MELKVQYVYAIEIQQFHAPLNAIRSVRNAMPDYWENNQDFRAFDGHIDAYRAIPINGMILHSFDVRIETCCFISGEEMDRDLFVVTFYYDRTGTEDFHALRAFADSVVHSAQLQYNELYRRLHLTLK